MVKYVYNPTHVNTLLNIQCDEDENTSAQSDVNGLLSTKVVDVPSQQRNCLKLVIFVAHVPLSLSQISLRVDVPSNQRR
jgi:hypothetical protein